MQFEIMDFQHLEADGNEALNTYLKNASEPTCAGAEMAVRDWIAIMVREDYLDDVPYIVTVEEDEGQYIAIVSDDDLPFILYSELPA